MNLSECRCQEANLQGICFPGTFDPIPCGQPGAKVVFHQHDGRNVYVMCLACADHNIKNRGGIEMLPAQPAGDHEFIFTREGRPLQEMHAMKTPPPNELCDRWVKCYLIGDTIHLGRTIG